MVKSKYGIQNLFLNCWMNSVLQIVCGSSLIELVKDGADNEVKQNFQSISQIETLMLKMLIEL